MDEEMGSTQHKKFCQSFKKFGILTRVFTYIHFFLGVIRVRRLVCVTSGQRVSSLKNTRASIINCWRLVYICAAEKEARAKLFLCLI